MRSLCCCTAPEVARRARAWIETRSRFRANHQRLSPAARGRGLKLGQQPYCAPLASPAARGRGLKLLFRYWIPEDTVVARRARAWIETLMAYGTMPPSVSSPAARGRGLKLSSRTT